MLGAKGWRAIERDGWRKPTRNMPRRSAIYQAISTSPNPALFTVVNADTCERLHFLVPFNAERAQA